MENWGLVTYREPSLLYNPNENSDNAKKGVASIISHEFAHQWFGDIVSPKFWTYLWLNEVKWKVYLTRSLNTRL